MEKPEYSLGVYFKIPTEKKTIKFFRRFTNKTRIRPEILQNIEEGKDSPSPAY